MTDRPEPMAELTETFEEAEELLDAEFEDVIEEDVERGFYRWNRRNTTSFTAWIRAVTQGTYQRLQPC